LAYPPGFSLGTYVNKPGILTIGSGTSLAQQFIFTISASGKGKATGLPSIVLSPAGGGLAFKVTDRKELTALIILLGASNTTPGTKTAPQILDIPCALQLGDNFFIYLTFQLKYVQNGNTGVGVLGRAQQPPAVKHRKNLRTVKRPPNSEGALFVALSCWERVDACTHARGEGGASKLKIRAQGGTDAFSFAPRFSSFLSASSD